MCSIMCYTGRDMSADKFKTGFDTTISRGPDDSRIIYTPTGVMAFHRLAIMGLTPEGMQPFERDGSCAICNGELYGFRKTKKELEEKGYRFKSESDCEIILPLYFEYGTESSECWMRNSQWLYTTAEQAITSRPATL